MNYTDWSAGEFTRFLDTYKAANRAKHATDSNNESTKLFEDTSKSERPGIHYAISARTAHAGMDSYLDEPQETKADQPAWEELFRSSGFGAFKPQIPSATVILGRPQLSHETTDPQPEPWESCHPVPHVAASRSVSPPPCNRYPAATLVWAIMAGAFSLIQVELLVLFLVLLLRS